MKNILDVIFPKRCIFCEKALAIGEKERVCAECSKRMIYTSEPYCMKCGKELENTEKEYCSDCEKRQHIYDRGVSVFRYGDDVRKAILRLKYSNRRENGKYFGSVMAKKYGQLIRQWNAEAIIPVPIHSSRRRKRGYNQAEIIADELSQNTGVPVDSFLIERQKKTLPQKELNDNDRKKNVECAFKICRSIVKYKSVVVIDDIYTTGYTIDECARVLKNAGVKNIYFITVSIGYET